MTKARWLADVHNGSHPVQKNLFKSSPISLEIDITLGCSFMVAQSNHIVPHIANVATKRSVINYVNSPWDYIEMQKRSTISSFKFYVCMQQTSQEQINSQGLTEMKLLSNRFIFLRQLKKNKNAFSSFAVQLPLWSSIHFIYNWKFTIKLKI